jgi:ribosomal protein S12 methylthiotransferase
VQQERHARFMETAARISAARLRARIGREVDVLVDEVTEKAAVGRSAAEAPEVDGVIRIALQKGGKAMPLRAGEFARVRITGSDEHDLLAAPAARG